ncbi:uncharacterized protein PHACADRAFT_254229 [Phanerochaete carnosa HHB-10118-sp]
MSSTSETEAAAAVNYENFLQADYFSLSARVLFLWDYCVTFDDEVHWIWSQKMNPATMLFIANRYVNLLITILELLEQASFQDAKSCGAFIRILQSLLVVALLIFSAFTTLRVYAIWGRDWRPALPVLALSLVSPVLNIIIDVHKNTQTAPSPTFGCAVSIQRMTSASYSKFIIANRATTIAYDGLALLLTLLKTMQVKERALKMRIKGGLSEVLVKDDSLYFLILLVVNLAQIVVASQVSVGISRAVMNVH